MPTALDDDYERAKDRALQLLRSVLPENAWSELEEKGVITIAGKRWNYAISPYSQTEIRDPSTGPGRCVAYACLQLSIPAPTYDRMVAEYLLIRNAEDVYWKTANIFSRHVDRPVVATIFMIALDIGLFANLFLEVFAGS